MTAPRDPSADLRFAIHTVQRQSGLTLVHYTAYRGSEILDTTLEHGQPFRFRDPRQVSPYFLSALEGRRVEPEPDLTVGTLPCQANPILMSTGDPSDLGYGMEPHYHQCPSCGSIWRHLRPILETGEGWGMERALAHMAAEERKYGRSTYKEDAHRCQECGYGPVFPWLRGPIAPAFMDSLYYPMKCA